MTPKNISRVFQLLSKSLPNPQTELKYGDNYQLMIAVILSAQATDVSVNRVTGPLFKEAPTPDTMIALGEKRIKNHIKSIGLYNAKAKHILDTSRILVEQYDSAIPRTRKELEALPGVGRKTAGVILNVAFGEATIPVDTHVFRVSNRLGLVRTKTPTTTEKQLLEVVPKKYLGKAHHLLILHGRYVCKARNPLCEACCVNQVCEFGEKTV